MRAGVAERGDGTGFTAAESLDRGEVVAFHEEAIGRDLAGDHRLAEPVGAFDDELLRREIVRVLRKGDARHARRKHDLHIDRRAAESAEVVALAIRDGARAVPERKTAFTHSASTARDVAGKGRPARAANSSINCHARTALGSTDSSAPGTPVTVFANVSMNCTHTRQNRGVSPTSAASPGWMPQFRIVSIIPGIDAAAPERTDTKSGSPPEPKRRPVFSSSRARCVWICASSPAGHCPSCS